MSKKEAKKEEDLDFEIKFIESVIKERPHFVEGLAALGDLYTKRGHYEKGLTIDEKLAKLRPEDPLVFYNLACSYSLLNDIDKALEAIQKSIDCGYSDFDYLQDDGDLENLRQDGRFQQFFSSVKKKV